MGIEGLTDVLPVRADFDEAELDDPTSRRRTRAREKQSVRSSDPREVRQPSTGAGLIGHHERCRTHVSQMR